MRCGSKFAPFCSSFLRRRRNPVRLLLRIVGPCELSVCCLLSVCLSRACRSQFLGYPPEIWNVGPPRGCEDAFFWIFEKSHFYRFREFFDVFGAFFWRNMSVQRLQVTVFDLGLSNLACRTPSMVGRSIFGDFKKKSFFTVLGHFLVFFGAFFWRNLKMVRIQKFFFSSCRELNSKKH